ncbi:MAG: outer membrane beta-barrel protein [Aquabacterium sp.]
MKKILAGLVMLAVVGATHAQQARQAPQRLYVGAAYGMTSLKISCDQTTQCDVHDSGPKIYAGLNLTPTIAVEAAYMDFGDAGYRLGSTAHAAGDARALVANLAFRHAFIPEFSGVLRAGFAYVKSRGEISNGVVTVDETENEIRPYFGIGFEYRFDKMWTGTLGADFTRGEVGDVKARLEMYSVGAQLNF